MSWQRIAYLDQKEVGSWVYSIHSIAPYLIIKGGFLIVKNLNFKNKLNQTVLKLNIL